MSLALLGQEILRSPVPGDGLAGEDGPRVGISLWTLKRDPARRATQGSFYYAHCTEGENETQRCGLRQRKGLVSVPNTDSSAVSPTSPVLTKGATATAAALAGPGACSLCRVAGLLLYTPSSS